MAYTTEQGRKFWYDFDKATKYDTAFMDRVRLAGAGVIQTVFANTRAQQNYPADFRAFVTPLRDHWLVMAEAQTSIIRSTFHDDWADVQRAFEDFGQGVLYDPDPERGQSNDMIHTMDVQGLDPPVGYHRWHASIRAIQLLQIGDSQWWDRLASLLVLTWAIQSEARPRQQTQPNPGLSAQRLSALRSAWQGLDQARIDRQYDLTGDVGYHPSPLAPAP